MFRYNKKGELHLDISLACSKLKPGIGFNEWESLTREEFDRSNKIILDGRDTIEIIEFIGDTKAGVFRDQLITYLENRIGKDRLEKLMLLI